MSASVVPFPQASANRLFSRRAIICFHCKKLSIDLVAECANRFRKSFTSLTDDEVCDLMAYLSKLRADQPDAQQEVKS